MNKKVKEDLNLAPIEVQDYARGSDKYMAEIEQWFKDHSDVITRYEFINPIYPLRGDPIWYNCPLIRFIYKNAIEILISCYHDGDLYISQDEDEYINCDCADGGISQLEELGIFDDDTLYDYVRDIDDAWDNFHGEFYFTVTSIGAPGGDSSAESYEFGYDSIWSLDECFPLDWVIEEDGLIDMYIDDMNTTEEKQWLVDRGLRTAEEVGLTEDITITEPVIPDWKDGHEQEVHRIESVLNNYSDITNYEINEKVIYPLRDRIEWWDGEWIVSFTYKNMVSFCFYIGGDVCIPIDGSSDIYMYGAYDLQNNGIYTDEDLRSHMKWLESEFNDYCDDNVPYINFTMDLVGEYDNEHNVFELGGTYGTGTVYGYDLGYEDSYSISEVTNWLPRFIEEEIPSILQGYDLLSNAELKSEENKEDKVEEDITPEPVEVPDFTVEAANKYGFIIGQYCDSEAAALDEIRRNRDNQYWSVGCWKQHGKADYFVSGLNFDEAWAEFASQLVTNNWLIIELRYNIMDTLVHYDAELAARQRHLGEAKNSKLTYQQILDDLIETFGYIEAKRFNTSDAIYILPNGRLLDTKGPYENSQHENIAKYIEEKYNIKDHVSESGSKFMNHIGAIRVTPWIPGIIAPSKKMTEKQEDTLFSVIKMLTPFVKVDHPLMIMSEDGSQFIEYSKIKNPEEVVTAILGYQIIGILKEHLAPGKEMRFLNKLNK